MTKVQEAISVETVGRGGLRLPNPVFEEDGVSVHPAHFIDFFRSTFRLNLKSAKGVYLPAENNSGAAASEQIVVPQGQGKPVVLLSYEFLPSNHRYRGSDERMRVLVPPIEVDEFQLYLGIDNHFRDPGTAGNRGRITVDHEASVIQLPLFGLPKDEFYEYNSEQITQFRLLGSAIGGFVELVS